MNAELDWKIAEFREWLVGCNQEYSPMRRTVGLSNSLDACPLVNWREKAFGEMVTIDRESAVFVGPSGELVVKSLPVWAERFVEEIDSLHTERNEDDDDVIFLSEPVPPDKCLTVVDTIFGGSMMTKLYSWPGYRAVEDQGRFYLFETAGPSGAFRERAWLHKQVIVGLLACQPTEVEVSCALVESEERLSWILGTPKDGKEDWDRTLAVIFTGKDGPEDRISWPNGIPTEKVYKKEQK